MSVKLLLISVVAVLCWTANAAPRPGYYGGYPAATSYSTRIDYHGPEYVKTYPLITTPIVKAVIPAELGYHHGLDYGYGNYGGYGGYGGGYDLGYGHHDLYY